MPIEKIPVVHKFGIISHSHRLEIQERIIAEAKHAREKAQISTTIKSTRPSYLIGNISEEFVKNYNYEKDPKKRNTLQQQADNILNLIKRRMTVNDRKDYEAVSKSWIDLSLLSQCNGEIQESSLEVLISSLGSGIDFNVTLLPAIMYLAEATLFWLKYKLMREPFLRTSELKLLRAGEIVFDRLYCHFLLGDLIGHEEFLQRLKDYNEEFLRDTEDTYSSYPTIVQSLSNISACANLLIKASPEKRNEFFLPEAFNSVDALETKSSFHSLNPFCWHALDIFNCVKDPKISTKPVQSNSNVNKALKHMLVSENFNNLNSNSSLHIIQAMKLLAQMASKNPIILKTFQQLAFEPPLKTCTPHEELDSEIEFVGSSIATESPKNSLDMYPDGMNTPANDGAPGSFVDELHSIELSADDEQNSMRHSLDVNALQPQATSRSDRSILSHRISGSLEQIKENESPPNMNKSGGGNTSDSETKDLTPRLNQKGKLLHSSGEVRAPSKSLVTEEDIAWDNLALVDKHLWSNTPFNRSTASINKTSTNQERESVNNSRHLNAALQERPSEARSSRLITQSHRSSSEDLNDASRSVIKSWPTFSQWPQSCAIAYTKLMGLIVVSGSTADIRKAALLGSNYTKAIFTTRDYGYTKLNSTNVGLIDLLYFQENGCSWAWKVRFAALEELGFLYNHLEGNAAQDGLRNICWASILDACIRDPDPKVAEAKKTGGVQLKVASTTSKVDSSSPRQSTLPEITLYGSILNALSDQQTRIQQSAKKKQQHPEADETNIKTITRPRHMSDSKGHNFNTGPTKSRVPTLKDELEVHGHLNEKPVKWATRNQIDLHRILEDQWRKDIHENNPEMNLENSLNSTPIGLERK